MAGEQPTIDVPSGYRIGGWEVRELLDSGSFASVYAARNVSSPSGEASSGESAELPAEAALKILATGTSTPRQLSHLKEMSRRELDVHRRLQQPRLIRMFEALTIDDPERPDLDGATVLVLERAEGSLAQLLSEAGAPLAAAPGLLVQICEGLAQIHHAGWVHGDLKPGNVLLMSDDTVRLGDFNLTAELQGTHAYAPIFTTPEYAPPELLWSEVSAEGQQIRQTADIWAFGILAHLLLAGTAPLPGGSPSARRDATIAYARGEDTLRLSPELPEEWRQIVTDCLAPGHEERAAVDAQSLLRRVEEVAGSERSPKLPRLRPRRIRPRTWVAAACVLVLLAGGSAVAFTRDEEQDPAEYGAEMLRTDRDVPVEYRKLIVDAARDCPASDVTPALVAALLKTESDFDPDLRDTAMDEYGIARWTPSVLYYWLDRDDRPSGGEKALKPPFPPDMAIPAVGRYLCDISRTLDVPGNRQVALAASYRTSVETVNDAGGVRPKERAYAKKIAHNLERYEPQPESTG